MNLLTTFPDTTLLRMERHAFREAARCWQEYSDSVRPSYGFDNPALSNALCDAAWSAEHHWRALHDERVRRGLTLA